MLTVFVFSAPLQPMMTSQQPAYQGMMGVQQPQSSSMMNTQRAGMNGQITGMMVQYPPMPSYQVCVSDIRCVCTCEWHQVCVTLTSCVLFSGACSQWESVCGSAAVSAAGDGPGGSVGSGCDADRCAHACLLWRADPHTTEQHKVHNHNRFYMTKDCRSGLTVCVCVCFSPSVGYLQPPSSDQYQMTQTTSPCSPQPIQQQYSGKSVTHQRSVITSCVVFV